jgi:hypothetical protein
MDISLFIFGMVAGIACFLIGVKFKGLIWHIFSMLIVLVVIVQLLSERVSDTIPLTYVTNESCVWNGTVVICSNPIITVYESTLIIIIPALFLVLTAFNIVRIGLSGRASL